MRKSILERGPSTRGIRRLRAFLKHPFDSSKRKQYRARVDKTDAHYFADSSITVCRGWRELNELDAFDLDEQRRLSLRLPIKPTFSIIVPLFRTPISIFEDMFHSVKSQTYSNWELCMTITEGDSIELRARVHELASGDGRVKVDVLSENCGISGNSNRALSMASGDWSALLDHDDVLTPDALYRVAVAINQNPDSVFIYSDRDVLDPSGQRIQPLLKPDWSPEIMLTANYLTHFNAMPTARLKEFGGWDGNTDGAQDWDLFLRVINRNSNVTHVPHILYHWRQSPTSVAFGGFNAKPYAADGQIRAVNKYLDTTGWQGAYAYFDGPNIRIKWNPDFNPSVLVILIGRGKSSSKIFSESIDEVHVRMDSRMLHNIDKAISSSEAELVVLLDANCVPESASSLDELIYPLSNPDIAFVGGCARDRKGRIIDYGVFFRDGITYPGFRGSFLNSGGPSGGPMWYRNASSAPGSALAFRKSLWNRLAGFLAFANAGRPDLAFCLEGIRRNLGRLMLNPYATFEMASWSCAFERRATTGLSSKLIKAALPSGDPYLHPELKCIRL